MRKKKSIFTGFFSRLTATILELPFGRRLVLFSSIGALIFLFFPWFEDNARGTVSAFGKVPIFGESKLLDFELEMAFITCKGTKLGETLTTEKAIDHIFGMVIFNDLSARDIQKWEYIPLGPYLGKSFGSIMSPWVVTMDALEPFAVEGYKQEPKILPYLEYEGNHNYDIHLEVAIQPEGKKAHTICTSNYKYMYWNMLQQLTHQSSNGCNINVGDVYASGTISGPSEGEYGSMLELSWAGKKTIVFPDGTERKFMQDNDTCIMRAFSEKDGVRIGFGECVTKILPAK